MSRSKQTSQKREKEKERQKKKKDKEERKEERKKTSNKGKGFDSMIAYVDEFGRLSDTPPDPKLRTEMKLEDIQLGAKKEEDTGPNNHGSSGKVSHYNEEKGYGFITDSMTRESLFFHISDLNVQIKMYDTVTFVKAKGPRGSVATEISKG